MIKFAMRAGLYATAFAAIVAALFGVITASVPLPAIAASQNASGDGSGIGGTGNSPSGGGIGGTGTREQNSPAAMPDVPDRPEMVETPAIEPPDLPSMDSNGADVAPPDSVPDSLPDIMPASPPAPLP